MCCCSWGRKGSGMTERLNCTDNSGAATSKPCLGPSMRQQGTELSYSMRKAPSPVLYVSTRLEALRTLSFWCFMEVSLYRQGWLNHWPLATDPLCSPSPPSRGQQRRWCNESSKTFNHVVGFSGNQPPSLGIFQKSARNIRHLYVVITYEILSFRSSVTNYSETKYFNIFCIMNHKIIGI